MLLPSQHQSATQTPPHAASGRIRFSLLSSDRIEFSSRYRSQILNRLTSSVLLMKPWSHAAVSLLRRGGLTGALCVARWPGSWEFPLSSRRWSGSVSMVAPVDHLSSRSQRPRHSSWDETFHPTAGCEVAPQQGQTTQQTLVNLLLHLKNITTDWRCLRFY